MTLTLFNAVSNALYLVADAIRIRSRDTSETSEWDFEKQCCLSLRATLASARDWSSSDGDFSHDQELNMLLQAALEPLLTVYDVLEPYINDLRQGCEDDAYREDIKQMKLTLEQSVIGPIMGLTTQVSELVRGINTLLLLFIIDGNITTRPHSVSVHHLTEMQALKLRAKITALPELDRMAQPYTPKTLSNEQEQQSLKTTKKKVEDHWDIVQVAIHGIWKNAALSETAGMPGHSVQSSAHRTPSGPSTHASSVKPTANSSAAKVTASNTKMRPADLF